MTDVARQIDLHPSTASYHVRVLERRDRITAVDVGRRRALYLAGAVPCPVARRVVPRIERPTVHLALATLVASGHITSAWLQRQGATESEARWALTVLARSGAAVKRDRGLVIVNEEHRDCLAGIVHAPGGAPRVTSCTRSGGRPQEAGSPFRGPGGRRRR